MRELLPAARELARAVVLPAENPKRAQAQGAGGEMKRKFITRSHPAGRHRVIETAWGEAKRSDGMMRWWDEACRALCARECES